MRRTQKHRFWAEKEGLKVGEVNAEVEKLIDELELPHRVAGGFFKDVYGLLEQSYC